MALTQTQINQRRRERYSSKKNNSNIDEIKKDDSNRDETNETIKSNEPIETKTNDADIYELLYNKNSEFEETNIMKPEPKQEPKQSKQVQIQIKPESITIQPEIETNDDLPKSIHKRNRQPSSRAMNIFKKIQNNEITTIDTDVMLEPKTTKSKSIDNSNTEVKDKILLQHKIKQYKILFPDELKNYKVKPNSSVVKLKEHLEEIEVLINLSSVDTFIMDSIFYCIKVVEGVSARTKNYNIQGLADILKDNEQFMKLCKQLYLKYNTFENVPPEYQLIMIVSTSAYICMQKNKHKADINDLLNQPYEE